MNIEEKAEKMLKMRSIPTPHCQLFQIHGSIFKPHPVCDLGQTSMMRISHCVLLFRIGKYALYCFFSHGIYLFAALRLTKLLDQIEILLPYMRCQYLLPFLVSSTFPLERAVPAALWIAAVCSLSVFVCCRMSQNSAMPTGESVLKYRFSTIRKI